MLVAKNSNGKERWSVCVCVCVECIEYEVVALNLISPRDNNSSDLIRLICKTGTKIRKAKSKSEKRASESYYDDSVQ